MCMYFIWKEDRSEGQSSRMQKETNKNTRMLIKLTRELSGSDI